MRAAPGSVACAAALTLALSAGAHTAQPPGPEATTRRGPVEATVRLRPARPRVGDTLVFTLSVEAEPGVELLMPSFGRSLERYPILDFAPEESLDAAGRTLVTHTYRLQAAVSGEHMIPAIVVEFVDRRPGHRPAPQDEDAFELLTEPLRFEVSSVLPAGTAAALRPRLGPIAEPPAVSHTGPLLAGLAVLAAAAGALWWLRVRQRGPGPRRTAFEIARTRLAELAGRPRPAPGDKAAMDAFFVEISDIVRRYVESRFGLHAPELTTEEFLDAAAASPDLEREQRRFLQDFLQRADQVKFAGHLPGANDVEAALTSVEHFLEQTREPPVIPSRRAGGSATEKARAGA